MRSAKQSEAHPIRPKLRSNAIDQSVDVSDAEEVMEESQAAGVPKGDGDEQEKVEPVKAVKNPATPSAAERAAHEITHWPFRDWCIACMKSRGIGQPHRSVKDEDKQSEVPRAIMDYGFIKEDQTAIEDEHGASEVARVCMTILVMVETLCNSVWAYSIEGKGAASADWLAPKIVEDMNTIGMANERIIAKSDQEPAIVQLQHEVARLRKDAGTAIENSRVGDSNSNGAVERAIREVKGMTRTLRCHLEEKLGKKIKLDDPIVPWMVRHAAYLITRCRVGPDGKTAMQKIKGRRVITPMLPFAEVVMFKLPKVPNMPGDFQDKFETGVWLGCIIRSGEHLIGTEKGVYTASSIVRHPEDKKWSSELVSKIKGTPREPVPGSGSSRVHAYAKAKEDDAVKNPKFEPRGADEIPEIRVFHINKADVEGHGVTQGCAGCRAIVTPGSKHRAKHTAECRKRFEDILGQTEEGAKRLDRARQREERLTRDLAERGEAIMQEQAASAAADQDNATQARGASASGMSEEQRQREVEAIREQENNDQAMEGEFGPHGHEAPATPTRAPVPDSPLGAEMEDEAELEAAPAGTHDIRVPLADRAPAPKRDREVTSPEQSGKWQVFEAHPKRGRDEEEPSEPAKWQTVEAAVETVEGEETHNEVDATFEDFLNKFPGPSPMAAGGASPAPTDDLPKENRVPVDAVESGGSIAKHPGPRVHRREVERKELAWQDIGSGTFARTFFDVKKLFVTTRGGPPMCDVYRRTVWSLRTGRVIDDCIVEDVPDHILYRELGTEEDVRVELVMKNALAMYERRGADVVELYSQPRIAQEATAKLYSGTKLTPGWSLDLTRLDPKTGKAWDLSDEKVQSRVKRMVAEGKPLFVIGSPPCTSFSSIQNMNNKKRDAKVVEAERKAGERHLQFCLEIYMIQIKAKRYFIHEHPNTATSWKMQSVVELMAMENVDHAVADMCQFGMTTVVDGVEEPVQKRTKTVSNSPEVLKRVDVRCPNLGGRGEKHDHAQLLNGRARQAQVYPKKFCQAVCEGIAAQKKLRALGLESRELLTQEEMELAADSLERGEESPSDALHGEDLRIAFDDQSGEPLDPKAVKVARKEEIAYFKEMKVYEKVSLDECLKITGKGPIGVKWVDINKGDTQNPNYRSRLVAMEFKTDVKPEWYAATPPSECLKIILSLMAGSRQKKMLYADVSRAYFYAGVARPVYVKLPEEDKEAEDAQMCGKLKVSMYGTRDAALNWALEYGETLKAAGYQQGVTNPCLFWHPKREVTIMVHGDDFVAIGDDEQLQETERILAEKYKIKTEKLGGGKEDKKEVRVLNKVIRYTDGGLELEADPRHAELVVRDLELEGTKVSKTPGVKPEARKVVKKDEESDGEEVEDDEPMEAKDATRYRAIVARLNYMAADRADIQFAVKEAARHMSTPTKSNWHALKRIGQYLKGRPRLVLRYQWQSCGGTVVTYTDSDWAGCKKTGRSTSGGIVTIGGHVIKTYSRQQKTVALSSAEAELHAMVAASAEAIGVINLCRDMGIRVRGEVYTDSSAAIGIAQRSGSGKVRHLRVQALWVQEVRSTGRLKYHKVLGTRNPSDILTKHVPADLLNVHLRTLGMEVKDGRAETAPTLDLVEAWTMEWTEEEEHVGKVVRFSQKIRVREIPAEGKGRSTKEASKERAPRKREGQLPGGASTKATSGKLSWADATDEEIPEVL